MIGMVNNIIRAGDLELPFKLLAFAQSPQAELCRFCWSEVLPRISEYSFEQSHPLFARAMFKLKSSCTSQSILQGLKQISVQATLEATGKGLVGSNFCDQIGAFQLPGLHVSLNVVRPK